MKAVFFDAGGTLIHIDHARVAAVIERELGQRFDPSAFVAAEYGGRAAVEAAMAEGGAPTDQSRWGVHFRGMLAALGLGADAFDRLRDPIVAEHRRAHLWCAVQPGTAEALAALADAGYYVACISNSDGTVDRLLEAAGLLRHLRFVVDSGQVGIEKPDPRIFELALARAAVRAGDAFYVGDVFAIDVVGARRAGLEPVLLDPLGRYGERAVRTATDVPTLARELVSARQAA